jgi:hypothetical protein
MEVARAVRGADGVQLLGILDVQADGRAGRVIHAGVYREGDAGGIDIARERREAAIGRAIGIAPDEA